MQGDMYTETNTPLTPFLSCPTPPPHPSSPHLLPIPGRGEGRGKRNPAKGRWGARFEDTLIYKTTAGAAGEGGGRRGGGVAERRGGREEGCVEGGEGG